MKLISFSLYGQDPKYIQGMYRNIELREEIYPDWNIIIFHDNSVPDSDIKEFADMGAILRNVSEIGIYPASWRFLAYDEPNVHRFISRDADSRISEREAEAVREWEDSGKTFHIMRDHPHHGAPPHKPILGGMWGMVKDLNKPALDGATMEIMSIIHQGGKRADTDRETWFWTDMNLLRDIFYLPLVSPENTIIHAAEDYMHKVNWANENWTRDFPSPRNENKNFIGEQINIIDGKEERAWQYRDI